MQINVAELDRYITGNYGEDQFKRYPRVKAYGYGVKARKQGKPITACRSKNKAYIRDWKWGWTEEDMEIRAPQ